MGLLLGMFLLIAIGIWIETEFFLKKQEPCPPLTRIDSLVTSGFICRHCDEPIIIHERGWEHLTFEGGQLWKLTCNTPPIPTSSPYLFFVNHAEPYPHAIYNSTVHAKFR